MEAAAAGAATGNIWPRSAGTAAWVTDGLPREKKGWESASRASRPELQQMGHDRHESDILLPSGQKAAARCRPKPCLLPISDSLVRLGVRLDPAGGCRGKTEAHGRSGQQCRRWPLIQAGELLRQVPSRQARRISRAGRRRA